MKFKFLFMIHSERLFFTIIFFLFFPFFSMGQPIIVKLKKSLNENQLPTGYGTFYYNPHKTTLTGVPNDLDTVMYWVCPMSLIQFEYEQFKSDIYFGRFKEESKKFSDKFPDVSESDFDGVRNLVTDQDIRYKIHAISALKNGRKLVAIDANNNGDLSDDIIMEFDTSMTFDERLASYELTPTMIINYDIYENGTVFSKEKIIRIKPMLNMIPPPNKFIEDMRISITTNERYTGTFELDKYKYNIRVSDFFAEPFPNNKKYRLQISRYGFGRDTTQRDIICELGKPFKIEDNFVQFDSIDFNVGLLWGNILERYEEPAFGPWERMTPPSFTGKDLSGNVFNSDGLRGKYALLIFWGTWCGPCKRDHPALKQMFEEYRDKNLEFVGIAVDRKIDIVKKYVETNKIEWLNLYYDFDTFLPLKEKLAMDYQITNYPTYILIDPTGKILTRGNLPDIKLSLKKMEK